LPGPWHCPCSKDQWPADKKTAYLKKKDSLQVYADSMINAERPGKTLFFSDSQFVK